MVGEVFWSEDGGSCGPGSTRFAGVRGRALDAEMEEVALRVDGPVSCREEAAAEGGGLADQVDGLAACCGIGETGVDLVFVLEATQAVRTGQCGWDVQETGDGDSGSFALFTSSLSAYNLF